MASKIGFRLYLVSVKVYSTRGMGILKRNVWKKALFPYQIFHRNSREFIYGRGIMDYSSAAFPAAK